MITLQYLMLTASWTETDVTAAISALGRIYTEARSYIHRRKDLAQDTTLLSTLHTVSSRHSGVRAHAKLATRGVQIWDLLAKFLSDSVLLTAAEDTIKLFPTGDDCEELQTSVVNTLATFYRVAPRHRVRLRQLITGTNMLATPSVSSQHVLNALQSLTAAEHRLPRDWASSMHVLPPGWIKVNELLYRCRANPTNRRSEFDSPRVVYKVLASEFEKETQKFLVDNELLTLSVCEGIIPWTQHVVEDGILYLARQDMGMPTLTDILAAHHPFDYLLMIKQLLYVLAYCANRNLSHGGISPHNVCYVNGNAFISDWGVERFSNYLLVKQGKPPEISDIAYVAPEARPCKQVKDRNSADIWSCGAILMRILEKKEPVTRGPLASHWIDGFGTDQAVQLNDPIAASLLDKLLQRQPSMRTSASNAMGDTLLSSVNLGRSEDVLSMTSGSAKPMTRSKSKEDTDDDGKSKMWPTADELKKFLIKHKVNVKKFGVGKAKSVKNLFWEISKKESTLEFTEEGRVYRQVTVVELKIYANTPYGRKMLSEQTQNEYENKDEGSVNRFIVKKVLANETWEEASHRTLASELRLSNTFQKTHMQLRGHRVTEEEREGYGNYPGLLSIYRIHTVSLQIDNVNEPEVIALNMGLPDGDPFVTKEANVLGTERGHFWVWRMTKKQGETPKSNGGKRGSDVK